VSRIAWFNCCAGVAGDMLLAALVDAGADPAALTAAVDGLGLGVDRLRFDHVQRCGIRALHTQPLHTHPPTLASPKRSDAGDLGDANEGVGHGHRAAREVIALIEGAALPERVRVRSAAVYRRLAEVEGAIHGVAPDEVELHEVGALDSIVDVVGVCAALESLGVDRIVCSPIAVGHGTVRTAHGDLPNPVPAVTRLLADAGAPAVGIDTTMELATPTGVALMVTLAERFGSLPSCRVGSTGFGAGTADPPGRPNVVQVVVGEADDALDGVVAAPGRPARLVEANVDDVTGEVLAYTISELLAAGAHDAWATPIVMKKGRPAHTVHALCDDATFAAVTAVMLAETGTLGLRASTVERWPQRRSERAVEVGGHPVRVKVAGRRVKVEHDDAATVAAALGIPLRDVLRRAEATASETVVDADPGTS
jgi:uncharacterized protein (TIGR00299 family) protein